MTMKRFYLTVLAMLATMLVFAQNNLPEVAYANASYSRIIEPSKHALSTSKDAVLTMDFEDEAFPPTGWDTICGAESQGNQHWYRMTGGRPDNGGYFAAIQRTASSTDATTRPQNEWLISPFFTVPNGGVIRFEFHSNYYWTVTPNNNADVRLKISEDGDNWTTIWNEDTAYYAINWPFSEWTQVYVDLNTYVGRDVKIAFQYEGEASCWFAIDNIAVEALAPVDYALTDGRVSMNALYANYGHNGMFNTFPRSEINSYSRCTFYGVVTNYGTDATPVNLVAKAYGPDDAEVFSFTFPTTNLTPGGFVNGNFIAGIDTISCYVPSGEENTYNLVEGSSMNMSETMLTNGTYRFEISLEPANGTYDNPNHRNLNFNRYTTITEDCLYSRDNAQFAQGGDNFEANSADWNNFFVFGTQYQLWNPSDKLNAIEAYICEAEEGAIFHYELYGETETGYQDGIMITESYTVGSDFTPGFLTLYAEDIWDLENEIEQEGAYIPVVACVVVENDKMLKVAIDETVQPGLGTNMAKNADNWYNIIGVNGNLMIRLYNCEQNPDDNAVETFDANEIAMFPNPTTGIVNFSNVENATIEVFNMMGQVVSRVEDANANTTIDLSAVANGNYVVRIVKNGEVATSKLNIAR